MAKNHPIFPSPAQLGALSPEVRASVEKSPELGKLVASLSLEDCKALTPEMAALYAPKADAPGADDVMSKRRLSGGKGRKALAGADRLSRLSGAEPSQEYLEATKRR